MRSHATKFTRIPPTSSNPIKRRSLSYIEIVENLGNVYFHIKLVNINWNNNKLNILVQYRNKEGSGCEIVAASTCFLYSETASLLDTTQGSAGTIFRKCDTKGRDPEFRLQYDFASFTVGNYVIQ